MQEPVEDGDDEDGVTEDVDDEDGGRRWALSWRLNRPVATVVRSRRTKSPRVVK